MLLTHENEVEIFQNARKLLEAGWIKGQYAATGRFSPDHYQANFLDGTPASISNIKAADCFCTLGAVRRAVLDRDPDIDRYDLIDIEGQVVELFQLTDKEEVGFHFRSDVAEWNDDPDRTHDQVLDRFDRIIAVLHQKDEERTVSI